jgi:flagellar biosynthesis protein FlhF
MLFIGPTGVGKTTTIAKIASIYRQHRKSSIGLITLDDQRIGGISQLAVYARILGVPMKATPSSGALKKALSDFSGKKLILIDTAGCNPKDEQNIERLSGFMAEIESLQVHLVLSTTIKDRDLQATLAAFSPFSVRYLLFTKVDESFTHGNILSSAIQTGIPLSYFANGRKVPDDIHVMTAKRLMGMILGEATLRQAKSAAPEILAERLQAFDAELAKHPLKTRPYRTYSAPLEAERRNVTGKPYAWTAESGGGQ